MLFSLSHSSPDKIILLYIIWQCPVHSDEVLMWSVTAGTNEIMRRIIANNLLS